MSFQSIPPKRAGPAALLTGDGLISEGARREWNDDAFCLFLPRSALRITCLPSVIDASALSKDC